MLVYQRVLTIDWLWSRVVKTRGRNGCFSADVLIDSHKPQRCSSLPLRSVLLGGFLKVWQDFLEMWKKWTRNWNPKQWASKRGFHSWMWPCLGFLKYEYPIVSPGASSFSPFGGFQQWGPQNEPKFGLGTLILGNTHLDISSGNPWPHFQPLTTLPTFKRPFISYLSMASTNCWNIVNLGIPVGKALNNPYISHLWLVYPTCDWLILVISHSHET